MNIVAMMLVRDDSNFVSANIPFILDWADKIIIGIDRRSEPSHVAAIQHEARHYIVSGRIRIIFVSGGDGLRWEEMQARDELLREAEKHAPTHGAIVDADEFYPEPMRRRMRYWFAKMKPGEFEQVPMAYVIDSLSYGGTVGQRSNNLIDRLAVVTADTKMARRHVGVGFVWIPGLTYRNAEDGYSIHRRTPYGPPEMPIADVPCNKRLFEDAWANIGASDPAWLSCVNAGLFCAHLTACTRLAAEVKSDWYKLHEVTHFPERYANDLGYERLKRIYDWPFEDFPGSHHVPLLRVARDICEHFAWLIASEKRHTETWRYREAIDMARTYQGERPGELGIRTLSIAHHL